MKVCDERWREVLRAAVEVGPSFCAAHAKPAAKPVVPKIKHAASRTHASFSFLKHKNTHTVHNLAADVV